MLTKEDETLAWKVQKGIDAAVVALAPSIFEVVDKHQAFTHLLETDEKCVAAVEATNAYDWAIIEKRLLSVELIDPNSSKTTMKASLELVAEGTQEQDEPELGTRLLVSADLLTDEDGVVSVVVTEVTAY